MENLRFSDTICSEKVDEVSAKARIVIPMDSSAISRKSR
jgi:hypothetical protein